MSTNEDPVSTFDAFAADYDSALMQGVSISGEDKSYFARGRVAWTASRLREHDAEPRLLLDFGCGTGGSTPYFFDVMKPWRVVGTDDSIESLSVARSRHGNVRSTFEHLSDFKASAEFDLAFCNGVFHHIPINERPAVASVIYRSLKPGGWFAFWENNPWNPGTRIVMSRIPFDRDAITLSAPQATRLLRSAGFRVMRTDFLFIFPNFLRHCRPLEPWLCRLPLGAQYLVLARKPER